MTGKEIIVKVADQRVGGAGDRLVTVGLGSCIAIVLHDGAACARPDHHGDRVVVQGETRSCDGVGHRHSALGGAGSQSIVSMPRCSQPPVPASYPN